MQKMLIGVLFAHVLSACASGPPSYEQNIQSAISGSGNVFVTQLGDGVIVLNGWVEDLYVWNAVQRAALTGDQVKSVINKLSISPW